MKTRKKGGGAEEVDVVSYGKDFYLFESIGSYNEMTESVKVRVYTGMLLVRGSVQMRTNDEQVELSAGDLFVFRPNVQVGQTQVSDDAEVRCICFSAEYLSRLVAGECCRADIHMLLNHTQCFHLEPDEADFFTHYFDLLYRKLKMPPTAHHFELTASLLRAGMYEFFDAVSKQNITVGGYTSADAIFRRFVQIIDSESPKPRRVDEYAARLNITPKYLSAVCKRKCGRTAIQIINQAVVEDIIKNLKDDSKNIKQIATELGFPNQSFLGTFLKKHCGLSPLQFRNKRLKGATE